MSVSKPGPWYIVSRAGSEGISYGPLDTAEVMAKIHAGEFSWADAGWHVTFGPNWKRLYEIPDFSVNLPPLPSADTIQALQSGRAEVPDEGLAAALWYLQFDGSEFGPMPIHEIEAILKRGKLGGQLMGWRNGFKKWLPVAEIPEFQPFLNVAEDAPSVAIRHADRKAFVAAIRFAEKVTDRAPDVFSGIARDISASGMRITTENVPKSVGISLIMSVQPVNTTVIPKFSVEAEVARIVGDRIFAIRFKFLDKNVENAITLFTTSSG